MPAGTLVIAFSTCALRCPAVAVSGSAADAGCGAGDSLVNDSLADESFDDDASALRAALSGFFGGCIEKIEDKTRKLTTVVAAKMNYELARTQVLECYDAVANEGTIDSYLLLRKPFEWMDMEIKKDQEDIYGKDGRPPTPQ